MMIRVETTDVFDDWLDDLRDSYARAVIVARIKRVSMGNMGDFKSVGKDLYELRIFYGPGYRLYFTRRGNAWVILLCGGDKSTQKKDIKKAKEIKGGLSDEKSNND